MAVPTIPMHTPLAGPSARMHSPGALAPGSGCRPLLLAVPRQRRSSSLRPISAVPSSSSFGLRSILGVGVVVGAGGFVGGYHRSAPAFLGSAATKVPSLGLSSSLRCRRRLSVQCLGLRRLVADSPSAMDNDVCLGDSFASSSSSSSAKRTYASGSIADSAWLSSSAPALGAAPTLVSSLASRSGRAIAHGMRSGPLGRRFRSSSTRVVALAASDPSKDEAQDELGDEQVLRARERLMRQFSEFPEDSSSVDDDDPYWVVPDADFLASDPRALPRVGSVLLANPAPYRRAFLERSNKSGTGSNTSDEEDLFTLREEPAAAKRTGRLPIPPNYSRREQGMLPVVLITSRADDSVDGIVLGWWSGKLLGDLEFPCFITRPLYLGGRPPENLQMLHSYPELEGATRLTSDGLALSDDFAVARNWVGEDGQGSVLRFKFFTRRVSWKADEQRELHPDAGVWLPPLRVSRDLLLREPDSSFEETLWVQLAQRAGGQFAALGIEYGYIADD